MDENAIKSWFDIAPHYIGFFLAFLKKPSNALASVKATSKISSDLVAIMLGGIALSYIIVLTLRSPALVADSGNVVGLLRKLDRNSLPFVALVLTVLIAVVGHIFAKIVARVLGSATPVSSDLPGPYLGGTVEDSVNAALGFAAVFVPVATATFTLLSWSSALWPAFAAALVTMLLTLVYLPLALSATHPNTSVAQAFLAVGVAIAGVTVALSHLA